MFRQMTDEQLAVWICMITAPRGDGKKNTRLRMWLELLKQEVPDNDKRRKNPADVG
jgi:hypothetical protein